MKNLIIISLTMLLCSCHVKQETDIEMNPRPSLVLGYEYLNDKGENTLPQEVRHLNIAVLNEYGETVSRADILKNQMSEYRPLYGVAEGEYTVITFGNADSTVVTGDCAMLDPSKIHASTDELFHRIERYDVQRGVAKLRTVSLDKLFFNISLKIIGLRGLDGKSVTDFSVTIEGTPKGFTSSGKPIETIAITPHLRQLSDSTYANFNVHKFDNAANILLTLKHKAETLVEFPLSLYLQNSKAGIDLLNGRDITIPIELDVTTAGVGITINDWHAATLQYQNVGQ